MESMRDIRSVSQRAKLAREDDVELDPVLASCEALKDLACAMGAKGADHDRRHEQSAAAPPRLRLNEPGALTWNSLRSSPNAKNAGVQVDVAPFESQSFALAQAKRQRDRIERLEAIASRGIEQPSSF